MSNQSIYGIPVLIDTCAANGAPLNDSIYMDMNRWDGDTLATDELTQVITQEYLEQSDRLEAARTGSVISRVVAAHSKRGETPVPNIPGIFVPRVIRRTQEST